MASKGFALADVFAVGGVDSVAAANVTAAVLKRLDPDHGSIIEQFI